MSEHPDRQATVKTYDFKRPDKFALVQLRTVQMMHETFARLMTNSLSALMRTGVSVELEEVDQETFVEFIEALPDPTTLGVVAMDPLRGSAVFEIDPDLTCALVDRSLGGPLQQSPIDAGRELTEIEELVIEPLFARVLAHLGDSWANVITLQPRLEHIERKPAFAQIVPPSEMVITVTFRVSMGEVSGRMRFCMPYLTIEPIEEKLSPQYWFFMVRRGPGGPGERGPIQTDQLRVDAQIAAITPSLSLEQLQRITAGEPVALPALASGRAAFFMGGQRLAELAFQPDQVAEASLSVPILSSADGRRPEPSDGTDRLNASLRELHQEVSQLRRDVRAFADSQRAISDQYGAAELADDDAADMALPHAGDARSVSPALVPHLSLALQAERDQTLAFCLGLLAPETAAGVLAAVPSERQPDVVRRFARLEEVEEQIRTRVGAFLVRTAGSRARATRSGGYDAVAEVLNHTPRGVEKLVMEQFMRDEKPLFEEIAKRMFVFEDFVLVDAPAIKKLASRVSIEEMALAMKEVEADVATHILDALDEKTAAALKQAIDATGRVRRRDVEAAQREMIEELRVLEEAGEVLVGRPDEMVE